MKTTLREIFNINFILVRPCALSELSVFGYIQLYEDSCNVETKDPSLQIMHHLFSPVGWLLCTLFVRWWLHDAQAMITAHNCKKVCFSFMADKTSLLIFCVNIYLPDAAVCRNYYSDMYVNNCITNSYVASCYYYYCCFLIKISILNIACATVGLKQMCIGWDQL